MRIRKPFLIAGILVVITVGLALVFPSSNSNPNVFIEIAPTDSSVFIDGKKVSGVKFNVKSGKHLIKAAFKGFGDNQQVFSVTGSEKTKLIVLLNPNSPDGAEYLRKYPDQQYKREALGGKLSAAVSKNIADATPITSSLPFIDLLFRIDYGPSLKYPKDNLASTIYITYYSPEAIVAAQNWIRFKGYDPNQLEIKYVDANAPKYTD